MYDGMGEIVINRQNKCYYVIIILQSPNNFLIGKWAKKWVMIKSTIKLI